MFVAFTFIATLVQFVAICTSLVYEIESNRDNFYLRKFIEAADEKLLIDKWGPNRSWRGTFILT